MIVQVTPSEDHRKPRLIVLLDADEPVPDAETVRSLLVAAYNQTHLCLTTDQIARLGDAEPIEPEQEE